MTDTNGGTPVIEEMTAREAHALLIGDERAQLIDVRTRAEWAFVGAPLQVGAHAPVFCEWQAWPDMQIAPRFVDNLVAELEARGVARDAPLLFLCRSGARSRAAAQAMVAAGWRRCVNISDGFQGPPDGEGHRSRLTGWQASGLPWRQN